MRDGRGLWKGKKKMNKEEFMESTNRLEGIYGKKLNETQIEFWFEQLSRYEIYKYKRAINELGKNNKTMPTIAEILSKIRSIKFDEEPKASAERIPCETCLGSGLVKYTDEKGYDYFCRCYCDNAKQYLDMPFRDYKDVFFYRKPNKVNIPTKEERDKVEDFISQINF